MKEDASRHYVLAAVLIAAVTGMGVIATTSTPQEGGGRWLAEHWRPNVDKERQKVACPKDRDLPACSHALIAGGAVVGEGQACSGPTYECCKDGFLHKMERICEEGLRCSGVDELPCFDIGEFQRHQCTCVQYCGNGVIDPGEECDWGSTCLFPDDEEEWTPCTSDSDCTGDFDLCVGKDDDGDNCSSYCKIVEGKDTRPEEMKVESRAQMLASPMGLAVVLVVIVVLLVAVFRR